MLNRLHSFVSTLARPKLLALLVGLLALTSYITALFFSQILSGLPSGTLNFGGYGVHDANTIYQALNVYGSSGRAALLRFELFEMVQATLWPLVFSVALTLAWRRWLRPERLRRLTGLCFVPPVLDYIQNLSVIVVTLAYPQRLDWLAVNQGYLGLIYSGLYGLVMVVLAVGLLRRLVGLVAHRSSED